MDGAIARAAALCGSTEPVLRLLITLFLSYPLAFVHRKLLTGASPKAKHVFAIITGFGLGYWNFGFTMLHTTLTIWMTYIFIATFGPTIQSVLFTFVFNMGYLLIGYLFSETDEYDVVWTMPECILVLRLVGLAWDYYDGAQKEETLSKTSKLVAVKQPPTLVEIMAFCYFPCSFLVGPQFGLKRYREYVNGKYDKAILCDDECIRSALKKFWLGIMYLLIHVFGSMYFSEAYILSKEYEAHSFVTRVIILALWGRFTLYKYFASWLLSEGSCIISGLSYHGEDKEGKVLWNGCANVDVEKFESATNFSRDYIDSFNINTNMWVFQYVYKRLMFLGNKTYSHIAVLIFLAVWHGFHTGYYMSFSMEFLCVVMEKELEIILTKNGSFLRFIDCNPVISKLKWIVLKLYVSLLLGPSIAPIALLQYNKWWRAEMNVFFFAHAVWMLWPVYKPVVKYLLPPQKSEKAEIRKNE